MAEIKLDDIVVDDYLLSDYKKSIGDFSDKGSSLDKYYEGFLLTAMYDLATDDISAKILDGELGRALTIIYAEALMNKTDIATNPTISLLRNKLSIMSKGER